MSLVIGLAKNPADQRSCKLKEKPSVFFEDDGYYWFLHPLFERLARDTGEYIDLYGVARFELDQLAAVAEMLTNSRGRIEAMPEKWNVQTAIQTHPGPERPLFSSVNKRQFVELIARFEDVLSEAIRTGTPLLCLGD